MRLISFLLCLSLAQIAQAKLTISGVSGASKINTTVSPVQIYGGIAGDSKTICQNLGAETCDTCANAPTAGTLSPCNRNAITLDTRINITFISDNTSGNVQLYDGGTLVHDFTPQLGTYTSGTTRTVWVKWDDICDAVPCTNGAETTKNFTFGVSSNGGTSLNDSVPVTIKYSNMAPDPNTDIYNSAGASLLANVTGLQQAGVTDFSLFPGDEKAYLDNAPLNFNSDTYTVAAIDAFYAEGACGGTNLTPVTNNSSYMNLSVDQSTHDLTDNRITDLTNGVNYVVRLAIEDDTGNIGFFTDDTTGTPTACTSEQHDVMPREVFGLLDKNQNCFISTAAYGSPFNSKVKTFHMFRDLILKKYSWGRSFINFYYKTSPPIAETIRHSETLKMLVRWALWPVWALSVIILKIGLLGFLSFLLLLVGLIFLVKKKFFKPAHLLIFALLFVCPVKGFSQNSDDSYFDLKDSTPAESTTKEAPPQEPPYTGTENEEDLSQDKLGDKKANYQEQYAPDTGIDNPNKWKPYHRVPEEKRLKELSDEGLFKISKSGEYYYKTPTSPQHSAGSLRFGTVSFPNLANPSSGTSFQQIYGEDKKFMLMADYEWQFFQSLGKLGLKFGSGLMAGAGHGQFQQAFKGSFEAKEKYTFLMFPNSVSLVYRLDIFNKQWLVPFAEAGADYFTFLELRDDGMTPRFGGAPAFHFAAGGSFLLDVLGRQMMAMVDKTYGVNHIWLTAEFRHFAGTGKYDFTDDIIDAGVMFEF